ncbi:hypothetical protein MP638_000474 [Amoeboaphelidium occidentale]|nr:hypothetical protein MP638_000474 [Amoeboaphelidium occidentale]
MSKLNDHDFPVELVSYRNKSSFNSEEENEEVIPIVDMTTSSSPCFGVPSSDEVTPITIERIVKKVEIIDLTANSDKSDNASDDQSPLVLKKLNPRKKIYVSSSDDSETEAGTEAKENYDDINKTLFKDRTQGDDNSDDFDAVISFEPKKNIRIKEIAVESSVTIISTPSTPKHKTKNYALTETPSKIRSTAKNTFFKQRETLAKLYFEEFNMKILKGLIPTDFTLEWSNRLTSTAGKAIFDTGDISNRKIQLSGKLLTNKRKLRNTLAHEMCHIAAYLSGAINENPHGKTFQKFGSKFSSYYQIGKVSAEDEIIVENTHDYEREYKFVYYCQNIEVCGAKFERNSKSIDITKKRCACGGSLLLKNSEGVVLERVEHEIVNGTPVKVKRTFTPVKKDGTPRKENLYAAFVKENYQRVKANLNTPQKKDVMKALAEEWRKLKI